MEMLMLEQSVLAIGYQFADTFATVLTHFVWYQFKCGPV
jgi:hypothetical protein